MVNNHYLVVWNHGILNDVPFSWEFHDPNWRTHIFQRGWKHQPVRKMSTGDSLLAYFFCIFISYVHEKHVLPPSFHQLLIKMSENRVLHPNLHRNLLSKKSPGDSRRSSRKVLQPSPKRRSSTRWSAPACASRPWWAIKVRCHVDTAGWNSNDPWLLK